MTATYAALSRMLADPTDEHVRAVADLIDAREPDHYGASRLTDAWRAKCERDRTVVADEVCDAMEVE